MIMMEGVAAVAKSVPTLIDDDVEEEDGSRRESDVHVPGEVACLLPCHLVVRPSSSLAAKYTSRFAPIRNPESGSTQNRHMAPVFSQLNT